MCESALALLFSQGRDSPARASSFPGWPALSLGSSMSLAFLHRGQGAYQKDISPKFRLWWLGLHWRLWRCFWGDGGSESSFLHMGGRAYCMSRLKETGRPWGPSSLRATSSRKSGGVSCWKSGHDLAMYTCSPEGQPCPGLHPKQCEGWDSAPLLSSCEMPPLVLHPALGTLTGSGAVSPEKAMNMISGLENLSCEDKLRWSGLFNLKEEKAPGTPYGTFQSLKGATGQGLFAMVCTDRTRGNGFKWNIGQVCIRY